MFCVSGYGFVDFDSPAAAQKAVSALKASGVQAQMAKVSGELVLTPPVSGLGSESGHMAFPVTIQVLLPSQRVTGTWGHLPLAFTSSVAAILPKTIPHNFMCEKEFYNCIKFYIADYVTP